MNIDTVFKQLPVYIIVLLLALILTFGINTAVTTVNRVDSQNTTMTIIIDPGMAYLMVAPHPAPVCLNQILTWKSHYALMICAILWE